MNSINRNGEILFQTMEHSDIEETASCISEVFSKFEPIAKALEISFDELYQFTVGVCRKAAEEALSILAKDRETGEIVGFMISEDFITVESNRSEGIDRKFEAVFSLLSDLEQNYRNDNSVQAGQVLHLVMLGVKEKYMKRQIATTLVKENLKLAKHNHFKVAIAEATAVGSQHLFRKLGFTEELEIEYKSYKFKDQAIFSSIENPPTCLLMSLTI